MRTFQSLAGTFLALWFFVGQGALAAPTTTEMSGLPTVFPEEAKQPSAETKQSSAETKQPSAVAEQIERARQAGFPALLIFSMDGCQHCVRMESEVLSRPEVQQRLGEFVVIKVDFLEERELAAAYSLRGVPAFVRLSPDGRPAGRAMGFLAEEQFLRFLQPHSREPTDGGAARRMDTGPLLPHPLGRVLDLPGDSLTEEDLAAAFLNLRNPEFAPYLRAALNSKQDIPRTELVALLRHRQLAVRLGAIEFLENQTGTDLGYSPWKDSAPDQEAALRAWEKWAKGTSEPVAETTDWSDPQAAAGALNDLLATDPSRRERGRTQLLDAGIAALPAIQTFLVRNPELPADSRNQIRQIRYSILLRAAETPDPVETANRLVQGSLDVRLQALAQIGHGSHQEIIFRDFLVSPEPLEREAAVEHIGAARSETATRILIEQFERETDENVRHGILKMLGDSQAEEARALLGREVGSSSEDLAIMALESLRKLKATSQSDAIRKALKDDRWRVRTAALRTIQETEFSGFDSEIVNLLSDEDEFVRITAIETAARKKIRGAPGRLRSLFQSNPELRPAIAEAFVRMEQPIPPEVLRELDSADPGEVLAVIAALPDADDNARPLLAWALDHEHPDVVAAAARAVAKNGLRHEGSYELLTRLFQTAPQELTASILSQAEPSSYSLRQLLPEKKPSRFQMDASEKAAMASRGNKAIREFQEEVRKRLASSREDSARRHAAILLTFFGEDLGVPFLIENFPELEDSQRVRLADSLALTRTSTTEPLFRLLLQDESPAARRNAVQSLLAEGADIHCLRILFEEFERDGRKLQGSEAHSYHFSMMQNQLSEEDREDVQRLLLKILETSENPDTQILALVALKDFQKRTWHWPPQAEPANPPAAAAAVASFLDAELPQVRLAAVMALNEIDSKALASRLAQLQNDSSPHVRGSIPLILGGHSSNWDLLFLDGSSTSASSFGVFDPSDVASEEAVKILGTLEDDAAQEVRERASLALAANRQPFRRENLHTLLHQARENMNWHLRDVVRTVFSHDISSLPNEFEVFLPLLESQSTGHSEQVLNEARRHFGKADAVDPVELALGLEVDGDLSTAEQPSMEAAEEPSEPEREMLPVVYFSKPGCSHCDRVAAMLERLKESFPEVEVEEWNINRNRSMEWNEALSERFGVPEIQRLVAPAVFAPGGYLIMDDLSDARLGHLVFASRGLDASFLRAEDFDRTGAGEAIAQRYSGIQIGVIIFAGLLDGLNPCAFATIIFLLSYLQIARKSSREILQIGLAYIAGVFSAYFLLGLGLTELLSHLVVLKWLSTTLNLSMAAFALVIAVLSIRDGFKCLRGQMGDMTLQLPEALKKRIHGVIRTSARHRQFVFFAFVVGAFISVLELACTGQVYAPTILYMMQAGEGMAIWLLLLYNVAFILPLAIIFGMAFFGMTSASLTEFLKRHAAFVKFALAALFFLLAALLAGREFL